jgi:hypothetical protein
VGAGGADDGIVGNEMTNENFISALAREIQRTTVVAKDGDAIKMSRAPIPPAIQANIGANLGKVAEPTPIYGPSVLERALPAWLLAKKLEQRLADRLP